jgi:quercetin dioxygenase-like cupin family protein
MQVKSLDQGTEIPFFPGVIGRITLTGTNLMAFYVELAHDSLVPKHNHPHEQMGICLQGTALFQGDTTSYTVTHGMTYYIPAYEHHSVTNIGETTARFLDFFSPPRDDYLTKASQSQKTL